MLNPSATLVPPMDQDKPSARAVKIPQDSERQGQGRLTATTLILLIRDDFV
jgi:hypothetical protein